MQAPGHWFQIDLGSVQTVKQIDPDANPSDYPRGYQVQVSQDGRTWGNRVANGTGTDVFLSIPLGVQMARYIPITQTGTASAWCSIAEAPNACNWWSLALNGRAAAASMT